jgi:acyl transferase domain-containing protein
MGPATFVKFCKVGALSPDGSRPFAKGANGFVMGEGAAMYVLKRLADAERDGDRVYAVIRAVGGASDGKGKGITAPNPEGQKRAVIRAYERAGFPLSTVTQIEAHGTSTIVGDVAEVAAINELYRGVDLPKRSVALGSIKSQIGHLKAAAGAAGMLKGILAIHHKVLAPSAQFVEPNPNIRFEDGPFFVNTEVRPWERPANVPRRLGVSAFGFGGTNFHVVLEEHVPGMLTQRRPQVQVPVQIGGVSGGVIGSASEARSEEPPMLRGMAMAYGNTLGEVRARLVKLAEDASKGLTPPRELPSAQAMSAPERVAIDFGSAEELEARATKAIECVDDDRAAAWRLARGKAVFRGHEAPGKIAFLFPGQGSQYVNMLRELRGVSSTVRRIFDEADES